MGEVLMLFSTVELQLNRLMFHPFLGPLVFSPTTYLHWQFSNPELSPFMRMTVQPRSFSCLLDLSQSTKMPQSRFWPRKHIKLRILMLQLLEILLPRPSRKLLPQQMRLPKAEAMIELEVGEALVA